MADYRIYMLNAAGHIERAEELRCESDEEAVQFAYAMDDPRAKEVWERSRRVSVILARPLRAAR